MTTSNPTETSTPLHERVWESLVLVNESGILTHRFECPGSSGDAGQPQYQDFRIILRPATVITREECLTTKKLANYIQVSVRDFHAKSEKVRQQAITRILNFYKAEYEPLRVHMGEPMGLVVKKKPSPRERARAAAVSQQKDAGMSTKRPRCGSGNR